MAITEQTARIDLRDDPDLVARLEVGDLLLIRTNSGIGRIVRALDRTDFNHCAVHLGDGAAAHVLPPKSLRGSCVAIEPFDRMLETLRPQLIDVRRCDADVGAALANGVLDEHERGPAFSFNDLLVLAMVADTSDRIADALAPIGPFFHEQADWEAVLSAHLGVAGPDAITCSELVCRSLPPEVLAHLPRRRRAVPDRWQEPIDQGDALWTDVQTIIEAGVGSRSRLHRPRGYTPVIAALDAYAVASGKEDLGTDQLRVALTVLRHLAQDLTRERPLDLLRMRDLLNDVIDVGIAERHSRLTTPGDLARSTEHFRPTGLRWFPSMSQPGAACQ